MGISGISKIDTLPEIEGCIHGKTARLWWDYKEGQEAPCLVYRGLPAHGAIVMSKELIIVVCSSCLSHVEDIANSIQSKG